nr:LOW QUALITY PROTEIN: uncharacterized protein LOC128702033 [Cherax quadricarinatus]
MRENTLRRARDLGVDANDVVTPDCDLGGGFAPIQCDGVWCFCVDERTGYELPGTRARSIELVNCSAPKPCAGYQCRMLCPYEFELDSEGCPLCECRDPCRGVTCPGDTACILEEIPCTTEPCPPLPTCKQPRSLSTLCAMGDPLMLDDSKQRPFLCGTDPGTPQCPTLYKCQVTRGQDYGVCCAAVEELEKPGQCPLEGGSSLVGVGGEEEEMRCGASCLHDLQCPSTQKCCISDICGQHCVQPVNLTGQVTDSQLINILLLKYILCERSSVPPAVKIDRRVLLVSEREGKGYVPQCQEKNGLYQPRQCSRNGLICWCVDSHGNKLARSLAAAHEVDCTHLSVDRDGTCPGDTLCSSTCEYGYKLGTDGCPTCDCDDPCEELTCPDTSTCVMRRNPGCVGDTCSATPMCLSNDSDQLMHPSTTTPTPTPPPSCPNGLTPLSVGGVVAECDGDSPCPSDHMCTPPAHAHAHARPACCPVVSIIEATKPGQCPFVRSASQDLCNGPRCNADSQCGEDLKCCVVPGCGPSCVAPQPSPHNLSLDHALLQGPTSSPLRLNESVVECGPEGSTCPSSHKCHLSPLGEYALCCPKPREVCYERKDSGYCEGSIKRWFFNAESNRCETFRFGGCGGNLNNFESEDECLSACPALSSCEKMREKNIRHADKDKKVTFIPKCDKSRGAWLPEQCLEELGVCWCVTPQGDQVPGSLTRGAPQCQGTARSSRRMNFDPTTPTNMICEPGQIVHVCDKSLCENQVCFSHPHAVCRVNPCGGCSVQFVDEFNSPVNCEVGLTECQRELQRVLNSPIFTRPSMTFSGRTFPTSHADRQVHYEVDLFRNVDVYHARPLDVDDVSSSESLRRARHIEVVSPGSLTVSGDVVVEAQEHSRNARAVSQNTVPESPLVESTLVDPDDLARRLSGPLSTTIDVFPSLEEYPPRLTLDDTFEAVPTEDLVPKPGTCPSAPSDLSLLTCVPSQQCMFDTHCEGSRKCCFNGCGAICVEPQETPASTQGMTVQAPVCEADGAYAHEQRAGGLTWCVDVKGHPIHETLTRGHVRCGPNGQILEQVSVGFVCARGVRARVCKNECRHASCHSHPDAVCVADPCNDCRVTFYSASGEKVHCEGRCSQPLARGMCRASFKRYFYNATADQCQEFIFGGCLGNDNNFNTMEECQEECQNPDICSQPVQAGVCSGGEARWYYNTETRKCEPFLYSGCGGNGNNFKSKSRCEARCPNLVLCPYWSAASMEPMPCSRAKACFSQTCHGHPEAICVTDPCTCTANFVDDQGNPLQCLSPTEPPKTRLAFTFEEQESSSNDNDKNEEDNINSTEEDSDELSKNSGPVTIYLEGEPTLTRCQLLQRHLQENNSMKYVAQCDEEGRFTPHTFYTPSSDEQGFTDDPKCWCVDEQGTRLNLLSILTRGERDCDPVAVESVVVTLGFRGREAGVKHLGKAKGKEIRDQVNTLLKQMTAETLENEVGVVDLPDLTQVKFTLLGNNKIDVAYQLEEKVKKGELALQVDEERLPADLRASWFHHQVSEPRWETPLEVRSGAREVVSEAVALEPPYLAATVIFTVISAMLVCGLVVAVVLYRRHKTGQYPKGPRGSMQSLAFSDTSMDRRSTTSKLSDQFQPPPPRRRPSQLLKMNIVMVVTKWQLIKL